MQAGLAAVVPDRVPVGQRGLVSGCIGIPTTVGVILSVVLVGKVVPGNAGYVVLAVPVVLLALPFVLASHDEPLVGRPEVRWRGFVRSFWVSPRRNPDFGWAWLTRFLIVLADSAAVLYLLYFLRDRIHYSVLFPGRKAEDGLALLLVVYSVVAIATAVAAPLVTYGGYPALFVCVAGILVLGAVAVGRIESVP